jgi:hypothetical protein
MPNYFESVSRGSARHCATRLRYVPDCFLWRQPKAVPGSLRLAPKDTAGPSAHQPTTTAGAGMPEPSPLLAQVRDRWRLGRYVNHAPYPGAARSARPQSPGTPPPHCSTAARAAADRAQPRNREALMNHNRQNRGGGKDPPSGSSIRRTPPRFSVECSFRPDSSTTRPCSG